jgi:regulator of protease activity HflC (stomatin/prohibitin superfamily)
VSFVQWLTSILQQVKLWAVVAPWERAVRVRLGKHVAVLQPGIHFRIPLADSVLMFNNRLRIASFPNQTLTTEDGRTISIAGNVGFRIEDPLLAMQSLQQPEYSVAALVQTTVSSFVTSRALVDIDKSEMEQEAKSDLSRIASGLAIEYVSMTDFAPVNRTFRVLGDEWRPSTKPDTHDKYEG